MGFRTRSSLVTVTVANGAATSSAGKLDGSYEFLAVLLPTIDSATCKPTISADGSTYVDVYDMATQQISGATTGGRLYIFKIGGFDDFKIVLGANQTAARTISCWGL
jgi:hypothetical protein